MTTISEFVKSGITGQTFREIREKFGQALDRIGDEDKVMSLYAIGFAWFREREHLPMPAAYDKAMSYNVEQIETLFEDERNPDVKAAADFVSQPTTTTP